MSGDTEVKVRVVKTLRAESYITGGPGGLIRHLNPADWEHYQEEMRRRKEEEEKRRGVKPILHGMAAWDRANRARAEANADAYKEKNEQEWEDARDKAGENAGGRRRSNKRGAKTVRRRRSRRRLQTRRRRPF